MQLYLVAFSEDISLRERYIHSDTDNQTSPKKETRVHLVFRFGYSYHKRWEDSKSKLLEAKIISIVAYLEVNARELRASWDQSAKLRIEREEQERIREEIEERKKNEIRKFKELIDESERWHKTKILRKYIDYIESNSIANHEEQEKWLQWAKDKTDWYDPLKNRPDEVLGVFTNNCNMKA